MIQQTSLSSYLEVFADLGKRQFQVFMAIKKIQPCTNAEIADFLHKPINTITPRCLELRQKELVCKDSVRHCRITGRNAIAWRIVR